MEIKELRIGNYISPLGIGITKVEGFCIWDNLIQSSNFAERDIEDFEPIPLTEDWLLKFGLKKIEEYCFELDDIHVNTKRELMWITTKCKIELEFNIPNYIHELQNLYFALTRKELETKNHPL